MWAKIGNFDQGSMAGDFDEAFFIVAIFQLPLSDRLNFGLQYKRKTYFFRL